MYDGSELILSEFPSTGICNVGAMAGYTMSIIKFQGNHTLQYSKLYELISEQKMPHWYLGGLEPLLQRDALKGFLSYCRERDCQAEWHLETSGRVYDSQIFDLMGTIYLNLQSPSSVSHTDYAVVERIYDNYNEVLDIGMQISGTNDDMQFLKDMVEKYPNVEWTVYAKPDWNKDDFQHYIMSGYGKYGNVRIG